MSNRGKHRYGNSEGYSDPTAHRAVHNIDRESERFYNLLDTIFHVVNMAGFRVKGRIVLEDVRTGRVWR